MKQLTEQDKYYKVTRWAVIGGFVLLVIILLLLFDRCNGKRELSDSKKAYTQIEDALNNVLSQDAHVRKYADSLVKENQNIQLQKAELASSLQLTRSELIRQSGNVKTLSVAVKRAKLNKDTASYIANCDSLSNKYDSLATAQSNHNVQDSATHLSFKNEIENLTHQKDLWQNSYWKCISAIKKVDTLLPAVKPRGKVIAVLSGIVTGPLIGIGGGFTYKTPRDILIGGKAYATNLGLMATVEFGVPISLRKRK